MMALIILVILWVIPFVSCQMSETYSFIGRKELKGTETDAMATYNLTDVRSLTECGLHCVGSCYMFSRDSVTKTCQLYHGTLLNNVKIVGSDSNSIYYRRKDCPEGMYLNYTDCLSCGKGQFQNSTGQLSCEVCPAGYYQDQIGQTTCKPCLNTTQWRQGTDVGRTQCQRCWRAFNTYTDGDMNKLIRTFAASHPSECARQCDDNTNCKLFTWRSDEGNCYLHSVKDWSWGTVFKSVIFRKYC